jgi:hypothetical protein
MPFINQGRRRAIREGLLVDWEPGDYCYIFYKEMVKEWKGNPRWTTAHKIYEKIIRDDIDVLSPGLDDEVRGMLIERKTARKLAWQVFFQVYVMPYEQEKREQNGDI